MIGYAIEASLQSKYKPAVYVTSDNTAILEIAVEFGATPIQRNPLYADDQSPKIAAVRDAVNTLESSGNFYDYFVVPQANSPEITSADIDKCIDFLRENNLWEVLSVDSNGIQNAAIRVLTRQALFNLYLSAHVGVVEVHAFDVHYPEDLHVLKL